MIFRTYLNSKSLQSLTFRIQNPDILWADRDEAAHGGMGGSGRAALDGMHDGSTHPGNKRLSSFPSHPIVSINPFHTRHFQEHGVSNRQINSCGYVEQTLDYVSTIVYHDSSNMFNNSPTRMPPKGFRGEY